MTDNVNNPAHYGGADNLYEHIKVMEATLTRDEFVGAMLFNITKYLQRWREKNGTEDVLKAQWYMNRLAAYLQRVAADEETMEKLFTMNKAME
jgi:Protein of unknwon function (DUF3310)